MRRLRGIVGVGGSSGSASPLPTTSATRAGIEPGADHHPPGGVGAVGGETPVVVGGTRRRTAAHPCGRGSRPGSAGRATACATSCEQLAGMRVHDVAADREHRDLLAVQELDPQALRRAARSAGCPRRPRELGRGLRARREIGRLGALELPSSSPLGRSPAPRASLVGGRDRLARRRAHGLARRLGLGGTGSSAGRTARSAAAATELGVRVMPSRTPPTPPGGPILTVASLKNSAKPLQRLLAGAADQPEEQEEGHHRGDEVGIGDLPGAAVVAVAWPPPSRGG